MMFSDPQLWFFVLSVAFISAVIQGIVGFGYAIVAMSLLPFFLNIRDANLIVAFTIVLPVMWIFWDFRKQASSKILVGAILGSLVGLPLGLMTFSLIELDYLVRGTGLVILLITVDGFLQKKNRGEQPHKPPSSRWGTFAGFCSGFLAGSTGIAGPPVVIYAVRQSWTPDQYKGFIFGFFILISVSRAVGLSIMGFATPPVLLTSALILPLVIIGMKLGTLIGPKIDPVLFKKCMLSLLLVCSLYMLIQGRQEQIDLKQDLSVSETSTSSAVPESSIDFL